MKTLKAKLILRKRDKDYIRYVSKINGWSLNTAEKEMNKFRAQSVSYRYYVKKRLWSRSGKGLERSLKNIEHEHRYDHYSLRKHAGLVAEEAGISAAKAKKMILESNLYTECSPRDYYEFRFWEKTLKEQKEYYTKGTVERLIMKYNTNVEEVSMIRSKIKFAQSFGDLFQRVWFTNRNLTFEDFLEKTKDLTVIFRKPEFGTHGAGCERIELPDNAEEKKAVYDQLIQGKKSIVEQYIVQHPDIAAFCDSSVNTVRLVTIFDQGQVNYMYSVLRMGTGALIDGYGEGGIFAPIDVETGKICRNGMDLGGGEYLTHPVSGKQIKDFQIPNWDKVKELVSKAAPRLSGVHLVGWDLAITPDGAVLIEGNSEPNYQFAQLPYVKENLGVRKKFEKFL